MPKKNKKKDVGPYKSSLELYTAKALKDAKLPVNYETETVTLVEAFHPVNRVYTRQSNGKAGTFKDRTDSKIRKISYTIDFTGPTFLCECKGYNRPTDVLKYKMYMQYLDAKGDTRAYFRPQNRKEVDAMIKLIKLI